jgi:hypothetical protein
MQKGRAPLIIRQAALPASPGGRFPMNRRTEASDLLPSAQNHWIGKYRRLLIQYIWPRNAIQLFGSSAVKYNLADQLHFRLMS